jgi:hypothetical protein
MTADPAAQGAYRVARSEVDSLFIRGEQSPVSRFTAGVVVSVDSANTCTVLINDVNVSGVQWLGLVPPVVGTVVELDMRGDQLVIPAINDLDSFREGIDESVAHIVSDTNPGYPPPEDLVLGGSMRSLDAWEFVAPDDQNWGRDLADSGQGLRVFQKTQAVFTARNYVTIPSAEAGTGPSQAGNSWTNYTGTDAAPVYSEASVIEPSVEQFYVGSASAKVTWAAGPDPAHMVLDVEGLVIGQQYTAQIWVYVPAGSPSVRLMVQKGTTTAVTAVKDTWVQLTLTFTATDVWHFVGVANTAGQPMTAGTVYLDAFSLVAGATPLAAYFDGSNVDTNTDHYLWLGTPHLSASEHYIGPLTPAIKLATNLVTQPSFEIPVTTPPWSPDLGAGTISTAEHYLGAQSLKLTNTSTTPYAGYAFAADAVKTGLDYWASAWVKSADTTLTVAIAPSGGVAPESPRYQITGAWQRIMYPFRAEADGTGAPISIRFYSPETTVAVGAIAGYIDAVMLTDAGALGYFDGSTAPAEESYYRWEAAANNSSSTWWTASPTAVPGSTSTLWSESSFDVLPGDMIALEAHLLQIAPSSTAQFIVMYGPAEGTNPDPTTGADVVTVAQGTPVAIGTADTTLTAAVVVPDTLAFPTSGSIAPQTIKIGIRFVGAGLGQAVVAGVTGVHTPKNWPLGSQWMNPDGQSGGLPTYAETGVGLTGTTALPIGTLTAFAPIPGMKKVVFTAPPGVGGLLDVSAYLSVNVPNGAAPASVNFEIGWGTAPNAGFFGSIPRLITPDVSTSWPVVARGLINVPPGETIEVIPQYRYQAANPAVAFNYTRGTVQAVFTPGAVVAGTAAQPSPVSYWDGDSWRPDSLKPGVIDVSKDATVGAPAKTPTTTTLAKSSGVYQVGDTMTLTATVTTGALGTVTFYRSAASGGPWTSIGTVNLSGTKATRSYTGVAGDSYFKATYNGSAAHATSTSAVTAATHFYQTVTKTLVLPCLWARGYTEAGAVLPGTTAVSQGYLSELAGNRKSLLRFDTSSVPNLVNITSVTLVCKSGGWPYWYYSGGGTMIVGYFINQITEPTTWPSAQVLLDQSRHDLVEGGFSLNITSWAVKAIHGYEAHTFSGITLGPGPSESFVYYGFSAQPGKDQWSLKIEYETSE